MDTETQMKSANILLVEDNPAHAYLAIEAFKDTTIRVNLDVVDTGEDALKYLHQEDEYSNKERPDLILLDLNLPGIDGREVLVKIKQDKALKCLPVVILTTSESENDLLVSYNHHANCYIKKPVDFDQFHDSLNQLTEFWFALAKTPTEECNAV